MLRKKFTTEKLVNIILQGIQEKKGKEIVNINLTELDNAVCQYFIICHGDSNIQVNAIANSVEEFVKKNLNERVDHKEGFENAQWILLDYTSIVVHIFQKEFRDFYNLEDLWADGKVIRIDEEVILCNEKLTNDRK